MGQKAGRVTNCPTAGFISRVRCTPEGRSGVCQDGSKLNGHTNPSQRVPRPFLDWRTSLWTHKPTREALPKINGFPLTSNVNQGFRPVRWTFLHPYPVFPAWRIASVFTASCMCVWSLMYQSYVSSINESTESFHVTSKSKEIDNHQFFTS